MSEAVETKQCTNCKIEVLSSNFTIHSVHCQRNFYLCSRCQQPVNNNNKVEHDESHHVYVHCTNCHLPLEKYCLDDHLVNDCPYRKVKCQICDIEVKATDIAEHENYCGSRTEKCVECGEFVMLKYKSIHLDSNHTFIKLSDEPGPSPSWQYGRRTLCNFMPDLTERSHKPASSHKRRSSEYRRRSRNSESKEESKDETSRRNLFESSFCDEKPDFEFKAKEPRKPLRRDIDDWATCIKSLHISEETEDKPVRSTASNSNQNEVDDNFMYALKVSQELNSHIWEKDSTTGEDEALKNSFKPLVDQLSQEKEVKKDMFALGAKPVNRHTEETLCASDIDNFNSIEHEDVKLPCEFCGALIPSNDLILHQSHCNMYMMENIDRRTTKSRTTYLNENVEKKVACGVCKKFFTLPVLEIHQLSCTRNSYKSWQVQDKTNHSRNLKGMNTKTEPGLQNGLDSSSPHLSRVGTRSEWLSELSKSNEGGRDIKKNLNHPETGVVTKNSKVSRKHRRAPSPPRM